MRIEIRNPKSEIRRSGQARLTNSAGTASSGTGCSSFFIRSSRRFAVPKPCVGRSLAKADHSSLEQGMITFLYIALLAIMMILVMVETSSLIRLRREVKLMEQQQIKRLSTSPANPVQTTTSP